MLAARSSTSPATVCAIVTDRLRLIGPALGGSGCGLDPVAAGLLGAVEGRVRRPQHVVPVEGRVGGEECHARAHRQ